MLEWETAVIEKEMLNILKLNGKLKRKYFFIQSLTI